MVGMVFEMATKYSDKYEVQIEVEKLAKSETIKIPEYMLKSMEENAKRRNIDYILMPSGAVHDSNYMASVTDVGMIFVPSIDGRSHVKEEYTSWDDIKLGGDLLLATILDLAT
jgi:allantoate deiminase